MPILRITRRHACVPLLAHYTADPIPAPVEPSGQDEQNVDKLTVSVKQPSHHSPMLPLAPRLPTSFSDIVTAANIAHSIYKALRVSDITGSSYEHECLIKEVHSFEQALRIVKFAITKMPPSGQLAQDIEAEMTTCLELLKPFLGRIESYQKALGGGRSVAWRKIGWSLLKAGEVARFREKLTQHKQNITLFLNGLMM
jgi:hypothetical protein